MELSKDGTTVNQMVSEWLKQNGYKGLCDGKSCGCGLDDLMPCGHYGNMIDCAAAYEFRCCDCARFEKCDQNDGCDRIYSCDENWCHDFEEK